MPIQTIVLTRHERKKKTKEKEIINWEEINHLHKIWSANAYFNRCFLAITVKP